MKLPPFSVLIVFVTLAAACSMSAWAHLTPVGAWSLFATQIGLAVGLLWISRREDPTPPADTVLKQRTIEDVEKQVEELEEQNRQIKASFRETTHTLREKQIANTDLQTNQQLLSNAIKVTDAEELYPSILTTLSRAFGAGGAALWILDEAESRMEVQAVTGRIAPNVRFDPVTVADSMQPSDIRQACERRLRVASPVARYESAGDMDVVPEDPSSDEPDGPDLLAVTLRDGDRVFGVVGLANDGGKPFRKGDPERLNGLAFHAAAAIVHAGRWLILNRELREAKLLHELSETSQTVTETASLYEALVEMAGRLVSFENCTVFAFDAKEGKLAPQATLGRVVNLIESVAFDQGSGVSGWVAAQRKPMFIPDLTKEAGMLNAELIPPRIRSFISVPMLVDEQLLGVINVSHSEPNAFKNEDARSLILLAKHAASTIARRGEA